MVILPISSMPCFHAPKDGGAHARCCMARASDVHVAAYTRKFCCPAQAGGPPARGLCVAVSVLPCRSLAEGMVAARRGMLCAWMAVGDEPT